MASNFDVSFSADTDLAKKLSVMKTEFNRRVVRSTAFAGAKVIKARAVELAPIYSGPPKWYQSGNPVIPGALRNSIYHAHTPEMSIGGKQVYSISWNTAKVGYAHLVEFGHVVKNRKNGPVLGFAPPIPFIRGAADKTGAAFEAMRQRAAERFKELLPLIDKEGNLPEFKPEADL